MMKVSELTHIVYRKRKKSKRKGEPSEARLFEGVEDIAELLPLLVTEGAERGHGLAGEVVFAAHDAGDQFVPAGGFGVHFPGAELQPFPADVEFAADIAFERFGGLTRTFQPQVDSRRLNADPPGELGLGDMVIIQYFSNAVFQGLTSFRK